VARACFGARGWSLLAVTLAAIAALVPPPGSGLPHPEAATPHTLSLEVVRPSGEPVLLQFQVAATSPEEALAAARSAGDLLIPGGTVAEPPPGVSAQWARWGWSWDNNEIPVPVAYNPTEAPATVSPDAILAGLTAWGSVETSVFAFRYAGITSNTASILSNGPDGENVISWTSLDCARGCVLGLTSKEATHEVDMLLNSNPEAATQAGASGTLDWRSVILHELGHMAGLEHSCPAPFGPCTAAELAAVMHYQYKGTQRKLEADDREGLAALYPLAAPPPPASPTPPSPGAPVPVVLERGWNLVVLPSGPVSDVTAQLGCVVAIYRSDGQQWASWVRGAGPAVQGFSQLSAGQSYWVQAGAACAAVFPA